MILTREQTEAVQDVLAQLELLKVAVVKLVQTVGTSEPDERAD